MYATTKKKVVEWAFYNERIGTKIRYPKRTNVGGKAELVQLAAQSRRIQDRLQKGSNKAGGRET